MSPEHITALLLKGDLTPRYIRRNFHELYHSGLLTIVSIAESDYWIDDFDEFDDGNTLRIECKVGHVECSFVVTNAGSLNPRKPPSLFDELMAKYS